MNKDAVIEGIKEKAAEFNKAVAYASIHNIRVDWLKRWDLEVPYLEVHEVLPNRGVVMSGTRGVDKPEDL